MPRQSNGSYLAPGGSTAVSGTLISSATFNTLETDIGSEITNSLDRLGRGAMQANLNMGSFRVTSAADPASAQDLVTLNYLGNNYVNKAGTVFTGSVGISSLTGNATLVFSKPVGAFANLIEGTTSGALRWAMTLGDASTETGSNNGSDFGLTSYSDAGATITTAFGIKRSTGLATAYNGLSVLNGLTVSSGAALLQAGATVTGAATVTGLATLSGGATIAGTTSAATLNVTGPATLSGNAGVGGALGVTGSTTLSTLVVSGGATLAGGATVTGGATVNGGLTSTAAIAVSTAGGASMSLAKNATSGAANVIYSFNGANLRWSFTMGDGANEAGGNAGSNWGLVAYNDAGAVLSTPIAVTRSSGLVTLSNGASVASGLTVTGGIAASGATSFSTTPTTATPGAGDNSTKVATTAFVHSEFPALSAGQALGDIGSYLMATCSTGVLAVGATVAGSTLTAFGQGGGTNYSPGAGTTWLFLGEVVASSSSIFKRLT